MQRRTLFRRGLLFFLLATLLLGASLGWANRQYIEDRIAAANFSPTPEMAAVMDRIALSEGADVIFRATHPTLEKSELFADQCAAVIHQESDQVVGCFTGSNIHLFEITDERLEGMVEVTAAHELLHAAFKRLSDSERLALTRELEAEYERQKRINPDLEERMSVYSDLNRDAFANELHSVLGTEVADLSPDLEKYYASYFRDRSAILSLFSKYDAYFNQLDAERTALKNELNTLGAEISSRSEAYQQERDAYNADVAAFNSRNSRFEFSDNLALFESIKSELQARAYSLENTRIRLNTDIDAFNQKRDRLITLDAEAAEVIKSISVQADLTTE